MSSSMTTLTSSNRIAILLGFALLLLSGCGDSDRTAGTPTEESVTPVLEQATEGPRSCPAGRLGCEVAGMAKDSLSRDTFVWWLVDVSQTQSANCAQNTDHPVCFEPSQAEVRNGYPYSVLNSHGGIFSLEQFKAVLIGWLSSANPAVTDGYGSGAAKIHTVGCAGGPDSCEDYFLVIASQLRTIDSGQSIRNQVLLYFEKQENSPKLVLTLSGGLREPDLAAALNGGTASDILLPDNWPTISRFYPVP
jgi:hypothetical protein